MNNSYLIKKRLSSIFLIVAFLIFSFPDKSFSQEEYDCPENSHHAGNGMCNCNEGYENYDGKCKKPYCEDPNSHVVGGDKCYCNDGYSEYNGKCTSMQVICRTFNARYNSAINNCECSEGYVEKDNYCVKNEEVEEVKAVVETPKDKKVETDKIIEKSPNDNGLKKDEKFKKNQKESIAENEVNSLLDSYYAKHDEKTQVIIKENTEKIESIKKDTLNPQKDIYSNITNDSDDGVILASFKIPIEDSFNFLDKEDKKEAEDQLDVLTNFTDLNSIGGNEISLNKNEKDVVEQVKENVVEESLVKEKKNWKKNLKKAEKETKLKEGITKDEFELERKMEERLKWQITAVQKSIGFEHLRIIEVTGMVKKDKMHQPVAFERMSSDYREYFGGKSAVSNEGGEFAGVVFDKSVKNINGMNKQLEDLKKALKKQYPKNWKTKYLDVPDEPTRESREEEIEKVGLFKFIEDGM